MPPVLYLSGIMTARSLSINGTHYAEQQLQQLVAEKLSANNLPEWEKAFYHFLNNWLDSSDTILVHTSGSTGTPKAMQLGKQQMLNSAQTTLDYLHLKPGQKALLSLSANYIAGKMMIVRAILGGLDLYLTPPHTEPLKEFTATDVDFTAWVPMQMKLALEAGKQDQVESIGTIILGGSPVDDVLREELKGFSNNIYETFGMTETISHIAMRKLSQGAEHGYFETVDDGIILGQDDHDCLVVIAPQVSNKPIITNDVVDVIDERRFHWIGRFDNVVNSGGIKLFPEMLEDKIRPLLEERFFLAGLPDTELGQKLVMVIESEQAPDPSELKAKLTGVLTRYEVPKAFYNTPRLEETGTGKINRQETLNKLGLLTDQ